MPEETADFTFDEELQHGHFVMYPSELFRNTTLSCTAKALYGLLLTYAGPEIKAWPGQEKLCEHLQISKNTLRTAIKELTEVGLLLVKRRGRTLSNLYHLKKIAFRSSKSEHHEPENDSDAQNLNIKKFKNRASRSSKFEPELNTIELDPKKLEPTPTPEAVAVQKLTALVSNNSKTFISSATADTIRGLVVEYGPEIIIAAAAQTALATPDRPLPYAAKIARHFQEHGLNCKCQSNGQPQKVANGGGYPPPVSVIPPELQDKFARKMARAERVGG